MIWGQRKGVEEFFTLPAKFSSLENRVFKFFAAQVLLAVQ